jgi:hypothetical protein
MTARVALAISTGAEQHATAATDRAPTLVAEFAPTSTWTWPPATAGTWCLAGPPSPRGRRCGSPSSAAVSGASTEHYVIATGSAPSAPPIAGLTESGS